MCGRGCVSRRAQVFCLKKSWMTVSGNFERKRRRTKRRFRRLERLESRCLLAAVSPPAFLQWFDSSFDTIERRAPDVFQSGYGAVWLPPPGRADSGNQSVGYDPYDRFDLGSPDRSTLYGTETGLKQVADTMDRASVALQIDAVINHAGFSDQGTNGFVASGGYPGLAITLPNAIDGDFHSVFLQGDLDGRLSGLVDIDHTTNHQLIRHPVDPSAPNNIAAGTTPDPAGRLANLPDSGNTRFYPDTDGPAMLLYDPATGESDIPVYAFDEDCGECGDAVTENAMGYLMRYLQWMVQVIGVDGFRIDAAKHFEGFVMNYLDRAVYRSNPRLLLDGSIDHTFSYSEVYDGDREYLKSFVKKTIDPNDPGRIGGNRDVLDFSAFFALHDNLNSTGIPNAWRNIRDSLLDVHDDGLHNGSSGVLFVNSHDDFGPSALNNVAHAYVLMHPGNAVVYFNGREFGDNRDFPKTGRGDALGGVFGDTINKLVGVRNTHGRGDYQERWIDDEGIYIFERESSALVALSNRGDSGFDERTVQVAFAPGTHLVELTGNASNATIDPFDDIPELLTVSENSTVTLRVPRNTSANNVFHGSGYLVYGLAGPQAANGLEIIGVDSILPGGNPQQNDYENGITRLSDLHVVTGDTIQVRLQTNRVDLLGQASLHDPFADGDNALLRLDGGVDLNGNGSVDFVSPGSVAYGFDAFLDKSSPIVGSGGLNEPGGDGEFLQTIDTTKLSEGVHFLEARAFRHRTDNGPAIFSEFKESLYIDRLPPESDVLSFEPFTQGINENRNLIVKSLDKTADNIHVFLNLPAGLTDDQILQMVGENNQTRQIDRDQFIFGYFGVPHGNNVVSIVTYEPTGNLKVERVPGLFTSTIVGSGLGDINFDGKIDQADVQAFELVLCSDNLQFNPAADFDANGWIDSKDLQMFIAAQSAAGAGQALLDALAETATCKSAFDFGDAPDSYPVTLSEDGARHQNIGPRLGNSRDTEYEGRHSINADADAGDEDGVLFGLIQPGQTTAGVNIDLQNAQSGRVDAWVDFNRDGVWENSEKILDSVLVQNELQTLNYSLPSGLTDGDTFARVRLSSVGGLDVTGSAADGEIEDYRVTIGPPARVESVSINDGAEQRSAVKTLRVVFDSLVDITDVESAFTIQHLELGGAVGKDLTLSSESGKTLADFSFTPGPFVTDFGSLVDGNYQLIIDASKVSKLGVELDGDADGQAGGNFVFGDDQAAEKFFRRYGDANGNGIVDLIDFASFRGSFGMAAGASGYRYEFDSNGNDSIDLQDFAAFRLNFGS